MFETEATDIGEGVLPCQNAAGYQNHFDLPHGARPRLRHARQFAGCGRVVKARRSSARGCRRCWIDRQADYIGYIIIGIYQKETDHDSNRQAFHARPQPGGAPAQGIPLNVDRIERFLSAEIIILPFDAEDAREAGFIRAHLKPQGIPIGNYDVC